MTNIDLSWPLQLPYSERQFIVILPDEAAKATREAEKKVALEGLDWSKIAELTFLIAFPRGELILDITKEAIKAWGRARQKGINVLAMGKSEAANIDFPPGHPR
ncbi:MAG: hypothetical protein F6J93_22320 [Oscillatoria sp. SIO1A7]|nr:hypothetical protein [Oscillatoria sp. SIO1A7]